MGDFNKDFYLKMDRSFSQILHENEQGLFVAKKGGSPLEMNYSRVFYDNQFNIYKRNVDRSVTKIEDDSFMVLYFTDVTGNGVEGLTYARKFSIHKGENELDITKEQYERVLIDSCQNIYKLNPITNQAVPADKSPDIWVRVR